MADEFNAASLAALRVNILAIGGIINTVIPLLNFIFAVLNVSLIIGMMQAKLLRIEAKSKLALNEMYSRDMHPKLKMSMMQNITNASQLPAWFEMIKEPGLFDDLNGPLPGGPPIGISNIVRHRASKKDDGSASTTIKNDASSTSVTSSAMGASSQMSQSKM
ncbi:unnamed protein product [Caenorhabditis bovis]|uniref:Uncharacterized protein n=1 Tax=Caenorhabditis bovis TaxID=2654633 RepID=A0A8S1FEX3_9PELO|nr:unnamed protein product [Caenorhabditis bovis]